MPDRSIETSVRFERPFCIAGMESVYPPGLYRLVRDEEELLGLSFVAYRLCALMIHTPAIKAVPAVAQVFRIEQAALDAALLADQELADLERFAPSTILLAATAQGFPT
jgi:diphthamide synthase (EF-2-diphthine--ammonia ligase)